jgi:ketosteroid isomerase-like protein
MDDSLIRRMFATIDSADWTALAECFHPEVTYERPGYEPLVGRDRLMRFYRNERAVAAGHHTIEGTLVNHGEAAAWGSMSGVLTDGTEVTVRFAEIYQFADDAIRRRRSYFFTPTV